MLFSVSKVSRKFLYTMGFWLRVLPQSGVLLFCRNAHNWPWFALSSTVPERPTLEPQEVIPNKKVGGLGPHITFGGKIWGKVRPSSTNKKKNLGSSVTTRCKSWGKVPILGSYLKFRGKIWGICHLYFWRQNLGLQQEFQRQILGPSPPTFWYGSTPLGLELGSVLS